MKLIQLVIVEINHIKAEVIEKYSNSRFLLYFDTKFITLLFYSYMGLKNSIQKSTFWDMPFEAEHFGNGDKKHEAQILLLFFLREFNYGQNLGLKQR